MATPAHHAARRPSWSGLLLQQYHRAETRGGNPESHRGAGSLQPKVGTGNCPAASRRGIPQEKRAIPKPARDAVAAHAGTVAMVVPPDPLGAGGGAKEDQPRAA